MPTPPTSSSMHKLIPKQSAETLKNVQWQFDVLISGQQAPKELF